jgi:ankyrin repeat protein
MRALILATLVVGFAPAPGTVALGTVALDTVALGTVAPGTALDTSAPAPSTQHPAPGTQADAFSEAVRKGDVTAVKKLLDEGVNVDTKFRYDRTALSFAADRGHVEVVRALLARGANVNAKDTFYKLTAIMWAISPAMERKPQHDDVVKVLIAHGGMTPETLSDALQNAKQSKLDTIVALLEQAGAKPKEH